MGHKVFVCAYSSGDNPQSMYDIQFSYIKTSLARFFLNKSSSTSGFLSFLLAFFGKIINRLRRFFLLPFYPVVSFSTPLRFRKTFSKVIKDNHIDIVISVIAPDETLYAGYLIKKRFPDVKWIAYYIDAGSNIIRGTNFALLKRILQTKHIKKENLFLSVADKIIIMKGHSHYYSTILSPKNIKKMTVADVPLLNPDSFQTSESSQIVNQVIEKWVYTGCMSGRIYNPIPLCRFFAEYHKLNHNSELHLYGSTDSKHLSYFIAKHPYIFFHNHVAHELIDAIQNEASVLVLFKCFSSDSVSGKIFEYIPHLKPIVALSPTNDICSSVLSNYSLSCHADINSSPVLNAKKVRDFILTIQKIPIPSLSFIYDRFSLSFPITTAKIIIS